MADSHHRLLLVAILMIAGCRYQFDARSDAVASSDGAGDGPRAPIAFVQSDNTSCGAAASCARAFAAPSHPGSMIIVTTTYDSTSVDVLSVTDTAGDSYVETFPPVAWPTSPFRTSVWTTTYAGPGALLAITATYSGVTPSFSYLYLDEYANVAAIDQKSVTVGTSSVPSSGSRTTTVADELIFGHCEGALGTVDVGIGFTLRSNANMNVEEDRAVTAVGTYDANFALPGGAEYVALMLTLR